jgi:hypothetical protein
MHPLPQCTLALPVSCVWHSESWFIWRQLSREVGACWELLTLPMLTHKLPCSAQCAPRSAVLRVFPASRRRKAELSSGAGNARSGRGSMRVPRSMTCGVLGVVLALVVGASASRPLEAVVTGSDSHRVATDAEVDLNQLDFDAFVVRAASACNRPTPRAGDDADTRPVRCILLGVRDGCDERG